MVTNPTSSQNIVQPASSGVSTQFSTNNLAKIRYVTASWNWSYTDSGGSLGNLTSAGSGLTLTFTCSSGTPCPLGIDTSGNANHPYYVYISGTGTAEAALVTGGTCTSGATTGTCNLTVTTVNNHPNGYTVGSASTGIAEAVNDAAALSGSTVQNYTVVQLLPAVSSAPNYTVYAPVFVRAGYTKVSGYGAVLACYTRSVCLFNADFNGGGYPGAEALNNVIEGIQFVSKVNVDGLQISSVSASSGVYTVTTTTNVSPNLQNGDWVIFFYSTPAQTQEAKIQIRTGSNCSPSCSATQFQYTIGSTTFSSSSGYGWVSIENAASEDYGQQAVYRDITIGSDGTNYFNWGIVIGNDQETKIDGFYPQVIKCSSTNFCGATIYGRGDQGISPVLNIEHATISMQCAGNGIRDAAGNTLHVGHSVVQGFSQYGIYYRGGLQGLTVESVYQESGACLNPSYNASYPTGALMAQAGIITGSNVTFLSDDPIGGVTPGYGVAGFPVVTSGSTVYHYYVVLESGGTHSYGMFYIGDSAGTASGSGNNITVYWPQPNLDNIPSLTYDLLASTGSTPPVLGAAATIAVATGLSCSGSLVNAGVCTYTDTQAVRTSYTPAGFSGTATLNFWPGATVLSGNATAMVNKCGQNALWVTTTYMPSVFCHQGIGVGNTWQHGITFESFLQGFTPNNPSVGATLKVSGSPSGSSPSSVKGLFNFINPNTLGQADLITLADCNPFLTLATGGYRPAWSTCDTAIGFDAVGSLSSVGVYTRASSSISQYINVLPNGSNWSERLNSSGKTFSVAVNGQAGFEQNGTALGQYCGTTTSCGNTARPLARQVYGTVALSSGTATVSGFSPTFTSTSSFVCTGTDGTSAASVKIVNASASSITITGTGTDTVGYICIGT